jgi:carboxypeptidase family protein
MVICAPSRSVGCPGVIDLFPLQAFTEILHRHKMIILAQGGLITGRITGAATGNPLPQAMVWAREVGGLTRDADFLLDSDGTYRLVVPAGNYRLRAADVRQGYPSRAFPGNPVHVTPGGTTPASWALQRW